MKEISVKFDPVPPSANPLRYTQTLTYQTIVQIFDKRQTVRGIRSLKHEFRLKRRAFLEKGRLDAYKQIVLQYKK